jgi:hypothetical protein
MKKALIMKKALMLLCITLFAISCNNDEDSLQQEPDYSEFLANDVLQIEATFNNSNFNWVLDEENIQFFDGWFDLEDTETVVFAGLQELGTGSPYNNMFVIYSPIFDYTNSEEIDLVFDPGMKELGTLDNQFSFRMFFNDVEYNSCDENSGYELEVLQRSNVYTFGDSDYIDVWFRIDGLDFGQCVENSISAQLSNALFKVKFGLR